MKRRLLIAAIFLLAGAVVNVAVAWGCLAVLRPPLSTLQESNASTTAWWNENKPDGFTDELGGFYSAGRSGWSRVTLLSGRRRMLRVLPGQIRSYGLAQDVPEVALNVPEVALYITAGLPMRSLHGQSWYQKGATIQRSGILTIGSQYLLPYVPIWPGFAVNTIFYAAILWLLIPGPFAMRRFFRVRRGLCPACAYPMGESDVCSECGKALRARMAVTT